MKKIIVLFYCRICVDILGFPIYLKHTKTIFRMNRNIVFNNKFTLEGNTLYECEIIQQH